MLSLPFGAVWIISIHALLAESDYRDCVRGLIWRISIHALLAESDGLEKPRVRAMVNFYPRSPCGERPIFAVRPYDAPIFLSTLSLRRATAPQQENGQAATISIHALLAESDRDGFALVDVLPISIHALLAESDVGRCPHSPLIWYFYPRSPCGERRDNVKYCCSIHDFYPRSPCGERRRHYLGGLYRTLISIHALLAESDFDTSHFLLVFM